jgi:hypothetical protein
VLEHVHLNHVHPGRDEFRFHNNHACNNAKGEKREIQKSNKKKSKMKMKKKKRRRRKQEKRKKKKEIRNKNKEKRKKEQSLKQWQASTFDQSLHFNYQLSPSINQTFNQPSTIHLNLSFLQSTICFKQSSTIHFKQPSTSLQSTTPSPTVAGFGFRTIGGLDEQPIQSAPSINSIQQSNTTQLQV